MDYRTLSDSDVKKLERELNSFLQARRTMAAIGWSLIGAGIACFMIFIPVIASQNALLAAALLPVAILGITTGVTVFILRSALYNKRINNRRFLIRQFKHYQENQI